VAPVLTAGEQAASAQDFACIECVLNVRALCRKLAQEQRRVGGAQSSFYRQIGADLAPLNTTLEAKRIGSLWLARFRPIWIGRAQLGVRAAQQADPRSPGFGSWRWRLWIVVAETLAASLFVGPACGSPQDRGLKKHQVICN